MSAEVWSRIAQLRQEEPEWGILPAAMRFKQDVSRDFGVEAAFEACRQGLEVPHLDVLRKRPVRSMFDAARTSSSAYVALSESIGPFTAPPLRVIGENDQKPFHGMGRHYYIACFEDCMIRGRSAAVYHHGTVLVDFEGEERARLPDNPEYDPGILYAEGDSFWTMEPDEAADIPEIEEAFMLTGGHTKDFGHWVTEYVPKIAMAALAGLKPMPVLIDRQMPKTSRQSLDVFMSGRTETYVVPYLAPLRVKRLWVASNPMYMGFYPTIWNDNTWMSMSAPLQSYARLLAELRRLGNFEALAPTGADRVYLARKATRRKKLLENHADVEALMERQGFKVLYPEDLSFIDQIRHVYHAKCIAGPEGSNMLLALFGKPGARILTLSSPHTFPLSDLNSCYSSIGLDYTVFTGPFTARDDDWLFWSGYRIDVEALAQFLGQWAPETGYCKNLTI